MSVLSSTRGWLRACPCIDKNNRFNVSHLGDLAVEYSLSKAGEAHRADVTGRDLAEYNLLFQARMEYGIALSANLAAAELFEELSAWLRQQEREHRYPEVPGGQVTALRTANAGMVTQADANTAVYQLQISLSVEED